MRLISPLAILFLAACASTDSLPVKEPGTAERLLLPDALVVLADGRVLVRSSNGAQCEVRIPGEPAVALPFCDGALAVDGAGALISSESRALRMRADRGALAVEEYAYPILDTGGSHEVVILENELLWRNGDRVIPLGSAAVWSKARILDESDAVMLVRRESGQLVRFNADRSQLPIAPDEIREIESFDVSPDEKEVVFSGRRTESLDVGLVSTQGSKVSWIVPDQLDEVGVTWAPRGSKVTYQVRAPYGTILRSVHVPTSWQLAVDLPFARVHSLSWEPRAEKYAVLHSGPTHSPAVEWISFGGEVRSMLVGSSSVADGEAEPFSDGVMIRPKTLRYNQKVPLILVVADDPLAWRSSFADARRAEVAVAAVTDKGLTQAIMDAEATGWIDTTRLFVVGRPIDAGPLTGVTMDYRFVPASGTPRLRAPEDGRQVIEGEERNAADSLAVATILGRLAPTRGK